MSYTDRMQSTQAPTPVEDGKPIAAESPQPRSYVERLSSADVMPTDEVYLNVLGKRMASSDLRATDAGRQYLRIQEANEQGRRGYLEAVTDFGAKDLPFIGDLVGDTLSIRDTYRVPGILQRVLEGEEVEDEDLVKAALFTADQERKSMATKWGMAGDITRAMPGYMAETKVYMLGSAWAGAKIGAAFGSVSPDPVTTAAGGVVGGLVGAAVAPARRLLLKHAQNKAGQALVGFLGKTVGREFVKKAGVAAVRGMAHGTAHTIMDAGVNAAANIATGRGPASSRAAAERMAGQVMETGEYDSSAAHWLAIGDMWVDRMGEQMGGAFAELLAPVGRAVNVATKRAAPHMKDAGVKMGNWLAKASGEAFPVDDVSKAAAAGVRAARAPISRNKWVAALGTKLADKAADSLDTVPLELMLKKLKTFGYDGFVEELLEERWGDFMRGLLGFEGDKAGLVNAFKASGYDNSDQFWSEIIAFATPMAVVAGAQRGRLALAGHNMTEFYRNISIAREGTLHSDVKGAQAETPEQRAEGIKARHTPEEVRAAYQYLGEVQRMKPEHPVAKVLDYGISIVESLATGSLAGHSRIRAADAILAETETPALVGAFNQVYDQAYAREMRREGATEEAAKAAAQAQVDRVMLNEIGGHRGTAVITREIVEAGVDKAGDAEIDAAEVESLLGKAPASPEIDALKAELKNLTPEQVMARLNKLSAEENSPLGRIELEADNFTMFYLKSQGHPMDAERANTDRILQSVISQSGFVHQVQDIGDVKHGPELLRLNHQYAMRMTPDDLDRVAANPVSLDGWRFSRTVPGLELGDPQGYGKLSAIARRTADAVRRGEKGREFVANENIDGQEFRFTIKSGFDGGFAITPMDARGKAKMTTPGSKLHNAVAAAEAYATSYENDKGRTLKETPYQFLQRSLSEQGLATAEQAPQFVFAQTLGVHADSARRMLQLAGKLKGYGITQDDIAGVERTAKDNPKDAEAKAAEMLKAVKFAAFDKRIGKWVTTVNALRQGGTATEAPVVFFSTDRAGYDLWEDTMESTLVMSQNLAGRPNAWTDNITRYFGNVNTELQKVTGERDSDALTLRRMVSEIGNVEAPAKFYGVLRLGHEVPSDSLAPMRGEITRLATLLRGVDGYAEFIADMDAFQGVPFQASPAQAAAALAPHMALTATDDMIRELSEQMFKPATLEPEAKPAAEVPAEKKPVVKEAKPKAKKPVAKQTKPVADQLDFGIFDSMPPKKKKTAATPIAKTQAPALEQLGDDIFDSMLAGRKPAPPPAAPPQAKLPTWDRTKPFIPSAKPVSREAIRASFKAQMDAAKSEDGSTSASISGTQLEDLVQRLGSESNWDTGHIVRGLRADLKIDLDDAAMNDVSDMIADHLADFEVEKQDAETASRLAQLDAHYDSVFGAGTGRRVAAAVNLQQRSEAREDADLSEDSDAPESDIELILGNSDLRSQKVLQSAKHIVAGLDAIMGPGMGYAALYRMTHDDRAYNAINEALSSRESMEAYLTTLDAADLPEVNALKAVVYFSGRQSDTGQSMATIDSVANAIATVRNMSRYQGGQGVVGKDGSVSFDQRNNARMELGLKKVAENTAASFINNPAGIVDLVKQATAAYRALAKANGHEGKEYRNTDQAMMQQLVRKALSDPQGTPGAAAFLRDAFNVVHRFTGIPVRVLESAARTDKGRTALAQLLEYGLPRVFVVGSGPATVASSLAALSFESGPHRTVQNVPVLLADKAGNAVQTLDAAGASRLADVLRKAVKTMWTEEGKHGGLSHLSSILAGANYPDSLSPVFRGDSLKNYAGWAQVSKLQRAVDRFLRKHFDNDVTSENGGLLYVPEWTTASGEVKEAGDLTADEIEYLSEKMWEQGYINTGVYGDKTNAYWIKVPQLTDKQYSALYRELRDSGDQLVFEREMLQEPETLKPGFETGRALYQAEFDLENNGRMRNYLDGELSPGLLRTVADAGLAPAEFSKDDIRTLAKTISTFFKRRGNDLTGGRSAESIEPILKQITGRPSGEVRTVIIDSKDLGNRADGQLLYRQATLGKAASRLLGEEFTGAPEAFALKFQISSIDSEGNPVLVKINGTGVESFVSTRGEEGEPTDAAYKLFQDFMEAADVDAVVFANSRKVPTAASVRQQLAGSPVFAGTVTAEGFFTADGKPLSPMDAAAQLTEAEVMKVAGKDMIFPLSLVKPTTFKGARFDRQLMQLMARVPGLNSAITALTEEHVREVLAKNDLESIKFLTQMVVSALDGREDMADLVEGLKAGTTSVVAPEHSRRFNLLTTAARGMAVKVMRNMAANVADFGGDDSALAGKTYEDKIQAALMNANLSGLRDQVAYGVHGPAEGETFADAEAAEDWLIGDLSRKLFGGSFDLRDALAANPNDFHKLTMPDAKGKPRPLRIPEATRFRTSMVDRPAAKDELAHAESEDGTPMILAGMPVVRIEQAGGIPRIARDSIRMEQFIRTAEDGHPFVSGTLMLTDRVPLDGMQSADVSSLNNDFSGDANFVQLEAGVHRFRGGDEDGDTTMILALDDPRKTGARILNMIMEAYTTSPALRFWASHSGEISLAVMDKIGEELKFAADAPVKIPRHTNSIETLRYGYAVGQVGKNLVGVAAKSNTSLSRSAEMGAYLSETISLDLGDGGPAYEVSRDATDADAVLVPETDAWHRNNLAFETSSQMAITADVDDSKKMNLGHTRMNAMRQAMAIVAGYFNKRVLNPGTGAAFDYESESKAAAADARRLINAIARSPFLEAVDNEMSPGHRAVSDPKYKPQYIKTLMMELIAPIDRKNPRPFKFMTKEERAGYNAAVKGLTGRDFMQARDVYVLNETAAGKWVALYELSTALRKLGPLADAQIGVPGLKKPWDLPGLRETASGLRISGQLGRLKFNHPQRLANAERVLSAMATVAPYASYAATTVGQGFLAAVSNSSAAGDRKYTPERAEAAAREVAGILAFGSALASKATTFENFNPMFTRERLAQLRATHPALFNLVTGSGFSPNVVNILPSFTGASAIEVPAAELAAAREAFDALPEQTQWELLTNAFAVYGPTGSSRGGSPAILYGSPKSSALRKLLSQHQVGVFRNMRAGLPEYSHLLFRYLSGQGDKAMAQQMSALRREMFAGMVPSLMTESSLAPLSISRTAPGDGMFEGIDLQSDFDVFDDVRMDQLVEKRRGPKPLAEVLGVPGESNSKLAGDALSNYPVTPESTEITEVIPAEVVKTTEPSIAAADVAPKAPVTLTKGVVKSFADLALDVPAQEPLAQRTSETPAAVPAREQGIEVVKLPFGTKPPAGVISGMRKGAAHMLNVHPLLYGQPDSGWLGNPFKWSGNGGTGTVQQATDKFKTAFLDKIAKDPAFRAAVLALKTRGMKLGYYRPEGEGQSGLHHLQAVQEWLAAQAAPAAVPARGQDAGFQGFKGGFSGVGKGTPAGDGKDKAMRAVADSAIVELASDRPSSSKTTIDQLGAVDENSKVVMLARNGALSGRPLRQETVDTIRDLVTNLPGVRFVVGDMPGVDSQFIDLLQELGASFEIYHSGSASRIAAPVAQAVVPSALAPMAQDAPLTEAEQAELLSLVRMDDMDKTPEQMDREADLEARAAMARVAAEKAPKPLPESFTATGAQGQEVRIENDPAVGWVAQAGQELVPISETQARAYFDKKPPATPPSQSASLADSRSFGELLSRAAYAGNQGGPRHALKTLGDDLKKEVLKGLEAETIPENAEYWAHKIFNNITRHGGRLSAGQQVAVVKGIRSLVPAAPAAVQQELDFSASIAAVDVSEDGKISLQFSWHKALVALPDRIKKQQTLAQQLARINAPKDEAARFLKWAEGKTGDSAELLARYEAEILPKLEIAQAHITPPPMSGGFYVTEGLLNAEYTVSNGQWYRNRSPISLAEASAAYQRKQADFATTGSDYFEQLSVNKGQGTYKEYFIKTPFNVPGQHDRFDAPNLAGWFRVREHADGTLEIQEIQSQLFQKNKGGFVSSLERTELGGVDKFDTQAGTWARTAAGWVLETNDGGETVRVPGTEAEALVDFRENRIGYEKPLTSNVVGSPEQTAFLNLMLKDQTWVPVFVNAITQWARNQGFTKVRFPTGETAARVEGHQVLADRLTALQEERKTSLAAGDTASQVSRIPVLRFFDVSGREFRKSGGVWEVKRRLTGPVYGTPVAYDAASDAEVLNGFVSSAQNDGSFRLSGRSTEDIDAEIQNLKTQGIEKLAPIEAFYEKRVASIVNRMGAVPVTDANGNTWRGVSVAGAGQSASVSPVEYSQFYRPEVALNRLNLDPDAPARGVPVPVPPLVQSASVAGYGHYRDILNSAMLGKAPGPEVHAIVDRELLQLQRRGLMHNIHIGRMFADWSIDGHLREYVDVKIGDKELTRQPYLSRLRIGKRLDAADHQDILVLHNLVRMALDTLPPPADLEKGHTDAELEKALLAAHIFTGIGVDDEANLRKLLPHHAEAVLKLKAEVDATLEEGISDYERAVKYRAAGIARFHDTSRRDPDTNVVTPRASGVVWTVPGRVIVPQFMASPVRQQLIDAKRDKDKMTPLALMRWAKDTYAAYRTNVNETMPYHGNEDGPYIREWKSYTQHTYGSMGFLGNADEAVQDAIAGAIRGKKMEAVKRQNDILALSEARGSVRTLAQVSDRMLQYLFHLKGLTYTTAREARDTILSDRPDLVDLGLHSKMTYADVVREINREIVAELERRAARGQDLEADITGNDWSIPDPVAIAKAINRLKIEGHEYSPRTLARGRGMDTFDDVYTKTGRLPSNEGILDSIHKYASDVNQAAMQRAALNTIAAATDPAGVPFVIFDPNLEFEGSQYESQLSEPVWALQARRVADAFGVKLDPRKTSKENLHHLVAHYVAPLDRQFKRLDSPYASVSGIYAMHKGAGNENVFDMMGGGEVASLLKHVFNKRTEDPYGIVRRAETLNSLSKMMAMQASLFFLITGNESMVASKGIVQYIKDGGPMAWVDIERRRKAGDPEVIALFEQASKVVDFGSMGDVLGIREKFGKGFADKVAQFARQNGISPEGADMIRQIASAPRNMTATLFDGFLNSAKLSLFQTHYTRMLGEAKARAEAEGREFNEATDFVVERDMKEIGALISFEMGGARPSRISWWTPTNIRNANLLMFSFMWTMSAANAAGLGLLTAPLLKNYLTPEQANFTLFKRIPRIIGGVLLTLPVLAQGAAYILGGGSPDDDDEFFPWNNEAGKKLHADITPLIRRMPWYKGEPTSKRRHYLRWGKQLYEVQRWIEDPVANFTSKLSQGARWGWEQATGETTGMGWELGFKDQGLLGLVVDKDGDIAGSRIGHTISKFLPFSVLSWARTPDATPAQLIGTVSKGVSYAAAIEAYQGLLEVWSKKDTYSKVYNNPRIKANLEALGAEILDAVERNGYDPRKVIDTAKAGVTKEIYRDMYQALNDSKPKTVEELARQLHRLNGKVQNVRSSVKGRNRNYGMPARLTDQQREMINEAFARP